MCRFVKWKYIHTCSFCRDGHPKSVCPRRACFGKQKKIIKPSTLVKVPELKRTLRNHPNHCFVSYLITGLIHGFLASLSWLPKTSFICKNVQSAFMELEIIDSLLEKDVRKDVSPFPVIRVNPLDVATRKYSDKKHLIIAWSAPHDKTKSINILIPPPPFSLCYASIDDAILLKKKTGSGTWLSKSQMLLKPCLYTSHSGMYSALNGGKNYFAVLQTFGCRSSPKFFDTLSEALCCNLLNDCKSLFRFRFRSLFVIAR